MEIVEKFEEYDITNPNLILDKYQIDTGYYKVFRIKPFMRQDARPPYQRKDLFKISLGMRNCKIQSVDISFNIEKQALVFSNSQIPYDEKQTDGICERIFFVFTQDFLHQYENLNLYIVFQSNSNPVVELSDQQVEKIRFIYERILKEIDSDYIHRHNVLRDLILELLHFGINILCVSSHKLQINTSKKILVSFLEVLEHQFPIDTSSTKIKFRTPLDFADHLTIPIKQLNRSVKKITLKTTSQLIVERILQEAKILLKHRDWSISEIAFVLGFTEVTLFNTFFKKHIGVSPLIFRHV